MFRKYLIPVLAVAAAAVLGMVLWINAPGGILETAGPPGQPAAVASPHAGSLALPEPDVTGETAPAPAPVPEVPVPDEVPAPAVPDEVQTPSPDQQPPASTDPPVLVPSGVVSDCSTLQSSLADYQKTAKATGPSGFRTLLMGLEDLEGAVDFMAASNDKYAAVLQELGNVRRQWSTSLSAFDDGMAAVADTAAGEAQTSLQTALDSLVCTP